MSIKLQSPIVLPPESLCQNWISKDNFDLSENLYLSFKIDTKNSLDKEFAFSLFLINSEDTVKFGATTARLGVLDYSTKGEIGEGLSFNGNKLTLDNQDFLLDHIYPYDNEGLIKNQNPFDAAGFDNTNIISIIFDSTKNIFKEIKDSYNNTYFKKYTVYDFNTDTIIDDITDYTNPIFIQINKKYYILNFETSYKKYDILDLDNIIIKFTFENFGKLLKIDVLDSSIINYQPIASKYIDLDLTTFNNLKVGYTLTSPIETYDTNKKIKNDIIKAFHIEGKLKRALN